MNMKHLYLMMPLGVRVLVLIKSPKFEQLNFYDEDSVYFCNTHKRWVQLKLLDTAWFCLVKNDLWWCQYLFYTLHQQQIQLQPMQLLLWYIQFVFLDRFWVLWYKQLYLFWVYMSLYLWYRSPNSFFSSLSKKFILTGLNNERLTRALVLSVPQLALGPKSTYLSAGIYM